MNIKQLGWNNEFEHSLSAFKEKGFIPARVALEHKRSYRIYSEYGVLLAEVSGKLRFEASEREDFPAVGDWVVIAARPEEEKATIHAILPRFSKFSRKMAGNQTEEQIVAANINTVFIVTALNQDFNLRRIERYLVMAWESGANPVIVLSKADLCDDTHHAVREVESVALGVPIHVVSVVENRGLCDLEQYMGHGQTIALLGSSGAGKSTLTNYFLGDTVQLVQDIRSKDDRGKHTTTHRELFILPNGGIMIDTPGMRELQLWETETSLNTSFQDIEDLAESCQFGNCQHDTEPNCEIKNALSDGRLDQKRYDSYLKLQKELAYLDRKNNKKAQLEEKKKWKKISMGLRK